MKEHAKKIIAPVVIVTGISLYYLIGTLVLIKLNISNIIKMAAVIFSLIITIVFIMVLIERIKEIKQGEEDDLGKY
jgi:hypothetical protein